MWGKPWQILYCFWSILVIGLSIIWTGLSSENITQLLVIGFLLLQILLHSILIKIFSPLTRKAQFITLAILLAAVVEGFHMISKPVFLSLRVKPEMSFTQDLIQYLIDLVFTVPAYFVIFSVIWYFINRFYFSFWHYALVMGFSQMLGDGGLFFFLKAPFMLFFLPYPMMNYHAMNIIPFLAVRYHLKQQKSANIFSYLAIPAIMLTYFICGTIIKISGRYFGLES